MLENFVFGICKADKNWKLTNYIERTVAEIKEKVGDQKVILGLSGGVDSSVAAVLIHKAIGDQLNCIFVDTGLLRKDEGKKLPDELKNQYKQDYNEELRKVFTGSPVFYPFKRTFIYAQF